MLSYYPLFVHGHLISCSGQTPKVKPWLIISLQEGEGVWLKGVASLLPPGDLTAVSLGMSNGNGILPTHL